MKTNDADVVVIKKPEVVIKGGNSKSDRRPSIGRERGGEGRRR